jgi:hypothetical protein
MWPEQKVSDQIFFLLIKKVLGARCGACVILDLYAHAWIFSSC